MKIEDGWTCSENPSECFPKAGDGVVQGTEECDDKNSQSGDGCSNENKIENGWACVGTPSVCRSKCGDGI
jgi:cysteine-rich repeat protein